MARRQRRHDPDVVRITTAPVSRRADIRHREVRYVVSMTIRTLCFIGAVVAGPGFGLHWLMWVLIAASFFLPYIAVVMANTASPMIGADLDEPVHQFPELEHPDRKDP
ncbi:MAG TPA: DUF3099 domain-containing protein [Marmoricola sp.]|jgi:hypothetical protein|nr:DUF3099 domain-containing protein [Marmoricola sp.]